MKPAVRPGIPLFSSGPCPKRPGWSLQALAGAHFGRSHRAREPLARIRELLDLSRALLELPDEWRLGIVPGSDTGAIEMAMWSLLGSRGVDFLSWDNFGALWALDGMRELRPLDARVIEAPYGSNSPTSAGSTPRAIRCSSGTAPLPACGCPMRTGSPQTARA